MELAQVIKKPLMTEKTTTFGNSTYVFEVDRRAKKDLIRAAVEEFFSVKVEGIRICNARKKEKRTKAGVVPARQFKKAFVRLKSGQSIQLIEGA